MSTNQGWGAARNVTCRSYMFNTLLGDGSRNTPRKVNYFRKVYLSSLRKTLRDTVIGKPTAGGSKLLPLKNGGHHVLWDLHCLQKMFFLPFPRHNTLWEVYE